MVRGGGLYASGFYRACASEVGGLTRPVARRWSIGGLLRAGMADASCRDRPRKSCRLAWIVCVRGMRTHLRCGRVRWLGCERAARMGSRAKRCFSWWIGWLRIDHRTLENRFWNCCSLYRECTWNGSVRQSSLQLVCQRKDYGDGDESRQPIETQGQASRC